ncbi:auxin response factor 18-like isoform X3 [Prosopis cineraria]|uniref:auxin response factor 18-like isoform X3 n=1 Tax=Prosopis cineraria TaxID=364024 RepID=UPI0024103F19|nr:auxin response factor 18-like isoform X3 [Prosopis cineraria]
MKEVEKNLDPQLWHACAGSMVQMPPVNSRVFYFPQGHAEHAQANLNFPPSLRIPPLMLCRVVSVKFLADPETDEVFAKIRLVPARNSELDYDDDGVTDCNGSENSEKPASFAKTLTQSDANNGGGFSVPRYCAETVFPRLDYSAEPPVQTVAAKDVHGETWNFRHIYRGTPRRHLLTTGWSTFVNQKKLVAGDSIVFLRAENSELCVGIRRAKRGGFGSRMPTLSSGWRGGAGSGVGPCGGFSYFLREENNLLPNACGNSSPGRAKVRPESVMEAMTLAANGQAFEVVYYPRTSTPEFCIKAASVRAAMRTQWCCGMRFKMAFETEDSSRISWFMGTIASVQVVDPVRWPNSPWRLLQVNWDEPDLLQNVKCVSPWLIELVSNMPVIHFTPFSAPRKKLRLPQHSGFPLGGQFPIPTFSGNPLGPSSPSCCLSGNAPAGIQGARHAQFGISLSDLHLNNKLQLGLLPTNIQQLDVHPGMSNGKIANNGENSQNLSCLLTMGNTCLGNGHCKVFMESEDVGRPLDLSRLGSYEELYRRLANMFGIERSTMLRHVLYYDASGAVKRTGLEPFRYLVLLFLTQFLLSIIILSFSPRTLTCLCHEYLACIFQSYIYCVSVYLGAPCSDFMKTAKKLTILTDSGSKEF